METLTIDETSLLFSCSPSLKLSEVESHLNDKGYSLAYQPATTKKSLSLRDILEKRIPNRLALKYGEIDDICVALKAKRRGRLIATKNVPRAATGPDFKKIFIGSGTKYGTITRAVLKIIRLPQKKHSTTISFKSRKAKDNFLKRLSSSGILPCRVLIEGTAVQVDLEGSNETVEAEKECLKKIQKTP